MTFNESATKTVLERQTILQVIRCQIFWGSWMPKITKISYFY